MSRTARETQTVLKSSPVSKAGASSGKSTAVLAPTTRTTAGKKPRAAATLAESPRQRTRASATAIASAIAPAIAPAIDVTPAASAKPAAKPAAKLAAKLGATPAPTASGNGGGGGGFPLWTGGRRRIARGGVIFEWEGIV